MSRVADQWRDRLKYLVGYHPSKGIHIGAFRIAQRGSKCVDCFVDRLCGAELLPKNVAALVHNVCDVSGFAIRRLFSRGLWVEGAISSEFNESRIGRYRFLNGFESDWKGLCSKL